MNVGLPDGQMGNSEVGHLNIGTGRIVYQELTRITKSINDSEFFENEDLIKTMDNCIKIVVIFILWDLLQMEGCILILNI